MASTGRLSAIATLLSLKHCPLLIRQSTYVRNTELLADECDSAIHPWTIVEEDSLELGCQGTWDRVWFKPREHWNDWA